MRKALALFWGSSRWAVFAATKLCGWNAFFFLLRRGEGRVLSALLLSFRGGGGGGVGTCTGLVWWKLIVESEGLNLLKKWESAKWKRGTLNRGRKEKILPVDGGRGASRLWGPIRGGV